MFHITRNISIADDEIQLEFIRASGPGGQKVNKVATACQLRFDIANSPSLPDDVKARLIKLAGRRVSQSGVLVIKAYCYRTQKQNRNDALNRLFELVKKAAPKPRSRRKTKPTYASQQRRLAAKRRLSQTKRLRRSVPPDED